MHRILKAVLILFLFTPRAGAQDSVLKTDASQAASALADQPSVANTSLDLDPSTRFEFHSLSLRWDNDGTFIQPFANSDKHYTNGAKVDLAWTPPADWWAPDWWTDAEGGWDRWAVGLTIEQRIYTGRDITDPNPPTNDRPYAGYAALGLYLQRASETTHDHIELDLGVVGRWSGAERTQKAVHSSLQAEEDPRGWPNQIHNEPTINLSFSRTWKTKKPELDAVHFEFLPSVSADLGTAFTRAAVDLTFRIGPSLPDDFGPGRLLRWRDATGTGWDGKGLWGWNWYGYSRMGVRAVARDITLDGNTFRSSRSVNHEVFVGELEFGIRARRGNIELGYQINTTTNEFTTQDGSDSYGEISLTIYF